MTQADAAREWKRLARATTRKINAAWLVQSLTPIVAVASLIAFCSLFYVRSRGVEIRIDQAWPWALGALGLVIVFGWLLARRRFHSLAQGLVRLETRMHLHNALTAAEAGVGPWPEPPLRARDGVHWRWYWPLIPVVTATALVALGLFIPISTADVEDNLLITEPKAWTQMENAIEELRDDEAVEDEGLEDLEEKIELLRNNPEQDWYSHNSMEATDTLRDAMHANLRGLAQSLEGTERTLNALQAYAGQLSETTKSRLLEEYQKAVEGLGNGQFKANQQLRDALRKIDPNLLDRMDPQLLEKLREQLKKNAGACRECAGQGEGEAEGEQLTEEEEKLRKLLNGERRQGGIQRGPGHIPLPLGADETDLGTNKIEGLESEDYSRAAPGDLLEVEDGKHELDKSEAGPQAGGGIESTGTGGSAVWRDALLPDEKAVLKRYFD